ncbi:hypothetical protein EWB00_009736 [Schistosoma japonicum]|uniref:Uncharacterized protein n=1 Tax=Schistosoma japonicum TaxID=6182 RepID=A0A4Z2DR29_SCHJA|nr:hypothetical protein EWB00_009736 [Schistosoma japonicum]
MNFSLTTLQGVDIYSFASCDGNNLFTPLNLNPAFYNLTILITLTRMRSKAVSDMILNSYQYL